MKKETVSQYLLRRLDGCVGMHSRIAAEAGISQASISRIYLRKASPRLDTVDPLLAWFDKYDRKAERKKSASGVSSRANGVRGRTSAAAASAFR